MLAEIAMRKRDVVLRKTKETARQNLEHLNLFMAEHRETLGWIRPQGGMTAFPWLITERTPDLSARLQLNKEFCSPLGIVSMFRLIFGLVSPPLETSSQWL